MRKNYYFGALDPDFAKRLGFGREAARNDFMKRHTIILLLLLVLMILPIFGTETVYAESAERVTEEELQENIKELLDALDMEELQQYLDSLLSFGGVSIKEMLTQVINGDFSVNYDSLGEAVFSLFFDNLTDLLPAFAMILASALLCGILNSAKNGFLHSTLSDIINIVGYLAVGAVLLSCLIGALNSGYQAIEAMQKQMQIVYPLLLTLMAASGGTSSVAIYRPAVAFMSSAISELFVSVVLPTSVVVLVFSWIGGLNKDVKTDKLSDFFKSINKWLIGLTLGLFTLFLSVQGIAAAQYDGISLRTIKYVLSGSIPVVGGFLSGSVELIMAGSALIKNALGSFAIFMLLGTILQPILSLVTLQLFLKLSAAATEPIGGNIPKVLSKIAGDLNSFLAAIFCIAFLYFLTILLLVCSSGVIF